MQINVFPLDTNVLISAKAASKLIERTELLALRRRVSWRRTLCEYSPVSSVCSRLCPCRPGVCGSDDL